MAAPSRQELALLGMFRKRIQNLRLNSFQNSDMELLRWIRARDKNLYQAEIMLIKHIQWRKEVNYDQIMSWKTPKQCLDLLPHKIVGFDSQNHPVIVVPFGKWDLNKAIEQVGSAAILKSQWKIWKMCEQIMRDKITSEGVPASQVSFITDMEGLSISHATLPVLKLIAEQTRIAEANFPESVKYNVIINAPSYFSLFCKFCDPLLSERNRVKVHIYGKNPELWKGFLGSIFPHQVIPRKYGGSNDVRL